MSNCREKDSEDLGDVRKVECQLQLPSETDDAKPSQKQQDPRASSRSKTQEAGLEKCSQKISPSSSSNTASSSLLAWSSRTKTSNRPMCRICHRPTPQACVCEALPSQPLALEKTRILILQHPHESRRKNRSVPLLHLVLRQGDSIMTAVGRRLGDQVGEKMMNIIKNDDEPLLLLYPGPDAVSLSEAMKMLTERRKQQQQYAEEDALSHPVINVLVLDGTWKYAKEMHKVNAYPDRMIQIQLDSTMFQDNPHLSPRRFAIRSPPSAAATASPCLSTAEAIAWVTSELEGKNELYDTLLKPLDCMVRKWQQCADSNKNSNTKKTNNKKRPAADSKTCDTKHAKSAS